MSNTTSSGDPDINWDHPNILAALIVSIGAGLATGIGGALVFVPALLEKVPQAKILAVSLALSAGVMLYVSFIEIFGKSLDSISETNGMSDGGATGLTTICFFGGMLFCVLLEVIVNCMSKSHGGDLHAATCPAHGGPVLANGTSTASDEAAVKVEIPDGGNAANPGDLIGNAAEAPALNRMGIMTALAIAIHNLPEGLATFMATVEDTKVGASLGVAIAIHNIPEGLCVAMPIYYATGSKLKAFGWSLLSGVTEPIGGIVGFAILQPVFTPMVYGIVFSMVGGMMVFIVCHELLPASHKYMNNGNLATMWLIIGMAVMALSLVLFVL